jgi:lipopolysaccharide cholinephosphotransferase
MNKTLTHLAAFFILSKQKRLAFRKRHLSKPPQTILIEKIDNLTSLIKMQLDITKVPKATGPLRVLQKANCLFLKTIVSVLREHNIDYALYGGNLLGAVRHKGYIPWDDDTDIMVFRKDYAKIQEIIATAFKKHPQIYTTDGDCIRVFYKDTPLQIDIFVFDTYPQYLSTQEEKARLKEKIIKYSSNIRYDWKQLGKGRIISNKTDAQLLAFRNKIVLSTVQTDKKMIISGIEHAGRKPLIIDCDWVFPLKEMEYEGEMLSVPNKPELILQEMYGNYMDFPSDFHRHESITQKISAKSVELMTKILEKKDIFIGERNG